MKFRFVLLPIAALFIASAAEASTYRWLIDANANWNDPANWQVVEGPAGAGYPNLAGDVAIVGETLTAAHSIVIPNGVTITIGRLTAATTTAAGQVIINRDGTGLLVFDNAGQAAVVESSGAGDRMVVMAPVRLASHVTVNGAIDFFESISESVAGRTVTITGGSVLYTQPSTYTGTTTVTDGFLGMSMNVTGIRIPGDLVVGDGTGAANSASVGIVADSIANTANVRVNADGLVEFRRNVLLFLTAHTINDLTVAGGHVSIGMTGTHLNVQDVTMEGGEILLNFNANILAVNGSFTATSTAAGPATVRGVSQITAGSLELSAVSHDFTIADGPQPVDFLIGDNARIIGAAPASLNKLGPGVMRLNDASQYSGATEVRGGTLEMIGSLASSDMLVGATARLTGSGGVGVTAVQANGTLAPGFPVGAMSSGAIGFTTDAHFAIEILSGESFDRLNVTGTVNVGNATLDIITTAFQFPPAAALTIIGNDGSDPVVGTFAGLPEGATVTTPSGAMFAISYHGGDGNDVVLANVAPVTYFLSEGATGTFFDEDVLIANPNTVPAPVTMTFFLQGGGTVVHPATVPAQSRLTVHVDDIAGLENASASVEVRSDNRLTLAVERTMFWDSTHYGGHTANSVPRAERQWFFAEGAQNDFFNSYLLLANPGAEIHATVTFLRENEPPFVLDVPLAAQSRTTVYAGDHAQLVGRSFGITVDTPAPITAERAMYFASTPQRLWSGGHDNVGSTELSTSWFHPEGASGTFFNTFILMSNPQDQPANVTMKFLLLGGTPPELTKTIPAHARLTVNPAAEGLAALENASFSTVVTSDVPIVSERAMYWNTDGTVFGEGHASSGLTTTALTWSLAEGRVGGPEAYTTYILLANPQLSPASVKVTFLRESGAPVVKTYPLAPNTRFNIDVGGMVPELQNESFGALIEEVNGVPIAVERSVYWSSGGQFWSGGTNAVGAVIPR